MSRFADFWCRGSYWFVSLMTNARCICRVNTVLMMHVRVITLSCPDFVPCPHFELSSFYIEYLLMKTVKDLKVSPIWDSYRPRILISTAISAAKCLFIFEHAHRKNLKYFLGIRCRAIKLRYGRLWRNFQFYGGDVRGQRL